MKNKNKIALGVGIAATAAGIAGGYYFYGSEKGAQHRKEFKSWMINMESKVMDKLNEVKEVNKKAYSAVVGAVAEKYKQLKNVNPQEVISLANRMRDHWKEIKRDIEKTTKQTAKIVAKGLKDAEIAALTKKRV